MFHNDRTFALQVRKIGSLLRQLEKMEERVTPAVSNWWGDAGIGTPTIVGATTVAANGATTVQGAGTGTDSAHFRFKELSGDGFISAKLTSVTDVDGIASGGLMMRNGSATNAPFAAINRTAAGSWSFQYRGAPGGLVTSVTYAGPSASFAKLVRNGPLFSAYVSANGQDGSWQLVGTGSVAAASTIQAGATSSSLGSNSLASSTFEQLAIADPPPIGAGLEGVIDWAYSNAFVDLVKQSREFMTATGFQPISVDANGWATADHLMILQSAAVNTAHIYNGTYKLSFKGQAVIDKWVTPGTVTNVNYDAATNTTTADVTVSATATQDFYVGLVFRNTKRTPTSATGTGITDVKFIRPGYSLTNTPVFTDQFIAHLKPFSTLRFMDWLETNNSQIANWADRTQVTDARQTITGVSWEYIVQLANQLGKDLWINVPAHATNDYVTNLATFLKNNVSPDRAVYVEWSNEVWNWGFEQTQWNYNQAVAEVNAGGSPLNADGETNAGYWAWRRTGKRTLEISNIFRSVWGDAAMNSRIRVVLAGQSANPETFNQGIEYIKRVAGDPSQYLYGLAGAPYFSLGDIDHNSTNLTTDQVIAGLQAALQNTPQVMSYAQTVSLATKSGLKFVAYEGGPDTFGGNNIMAKKASQLDPRIAGIVTNYLNQWFQNGGGLFNWFVAGATSYDSPYGTWGLSNDATNTNTPKYQGINAALSASAPTFSKGLALPAEFSARATVGSTVTTGNRYAGPGDSLNYLLNAPTDATYSFRIRHAGDQAGRSLKISINGKVVQTLNLPATATWDTFIDSQMITIPLTAGANTLTIDVIGGGLQLGNIRIATGATRALVTGSGSTLTATVSCFDGTAATGSVQFYDGTTLLGSATLDATGKANFTLTSQGNGHRLFTAVYAGDSEHTACVSPGLSRSGTATVTPPPVDPVPQPPAPQPPVTSTPPKVSSVTIGDGVQRSMIRSIKVAFDRVVSLSANSFQLTLANGTAPTIGIATATINGKTEATITFAGIGIMGGSLADGQYTFRIIAANVRDASNLALTMDAERIETFHRLYGDADGDRDVDNNDFVAFQAAFASTSPSVRSAFDSDGDGDVDNLDLRQFTRRYGKTV